MKLSLAIDVLVLVPLVCVAPATAAQPMILHSFTSGNGFDSFLVSGSVIYGSTDSGAAYGYGSVYKMGLDGSQFNTIHSFSSADQAVIGNGIALDGSTIYGSTALSGTGGCGPVYKINTDGTGYQVLHSFVHGSGDGETVYSRLAMTDARLFGTAVIGGTNNSGIVFSLNKDGSDYQILHSFTGGTDGYMPYAGPVVSGSSLYGQTVSSVFKMNLDGTGYEVLKSGIGGLGKVTVDGSILYGIAGNKVYRMDTDGSDYQVLYNLDGDSQSGLALVGSQLYGMTWQGGDFNQGSIFRINTDGSDFRRLYSFSGGSNGYGPICDPVVIDNVLYGSARGGPSNGSFLFAMAVPEPSSLVLLSLGAVAVVAFAHSRRGRAR